MFDTIFSKKLQTKNHRPAGNRYLKSSVFDYFYLPRYGFSDYQKLEELLNSYLVSPVVYTGINMISTSYSTIEPVLKDKQKQSLLFEHPFLDLLQQPNPFVDKYSFMEQICNFFLLTGNSYIHIITNGRGEPIELQIINPRSISANYSFKKYPESYIYSQNDENVSFVLDRKSKRYFSNAGTELINLVKHNPASQGNEAQGASAICALQLEIQQYLESSIHNYSLLKNQGRPSGIVSLEDSDQYEPIEKEQEERIKSKIETLKGSQNAGNMLFLPFGIKWQSVSESIKDMDFATLKKLTSEAIFNALNIPLPLIKNESMTFSNFEAARYMFYYMNIIPLTRKIYNFLTHKILSYYPNSESLFLTFDPSTVDAIKTVKIAELEKLNKMGVLTKNEIRSELGKEEIAGDGASILYQANNLVPIGVDKFVSDQQEKPSKKFLRSIRNVAIFKSKLAEHKKQDGSPLYSKDEIDKYTEEYF